MPVRTKLRLLHEIASLLSRKWTLKIVTALSSGTKRRSELSKLLPGATQKVLTETLRGMERAGIVKRCVYPTTPPKVEYSLTEAGQGLIKVTSEFDLWFDLNHRHICKAQKSYDSQGGELA